MPRSNPQTTKKVLSFYWHHAARYPKKLVLLAITVPLAQASNNILPPLLLAHVLERLSNQDYVVGQPWQSFSGEIVLYTALVFSSGLIFWRLVDALIWRLEGQVQRDLAQRVFSHLVDQSADFHANNFGGSLVSQNSKLLSGYIRIADTTIFGTIPLFVTVFASAAVLSTRAPSFAAGLTVFAFLYLLAAFKISAPSRRKNALHAAAESKQTGYLADAITNAMAIKSFATNDSELERYAKVTEQTRASLLSLSKTIQLQMAGFTSMTSILTIGSLVAAIVSVVNFHANIATAFLIFNYTAAIIGQLFQFSNQALRNYNRSIGDASDMVEILETPTSIKDPEIPETARLHRGSIEFRDVTFRHKDADDAIFQKLNLQIKPGEKVGLVGHSGSGKTTFTRLLLRFSDLDSGSIEIDKQNIAKITQNDLRHAIAYVPQEPLLFHRTIAENIGYGDTLASPQQVSFAAEQAHAAEFIEKLPKGYDTLVGERGVKLSGGQRQRVVIARAMLKNAPILVLDEATSALDSESEVLIQDALWKLMEGRTAIVIAHRLSTIQKMDRILVMDNGKIVEEGTHKELLKKNNGIYASLWKHQSGGFLEDEQSSD